MEIAAIVLPCQHEEVFLQQKFQHVLSRSLPKHGSGTLKSQSLECQWREQLLIQYMLKTTQKETSASSGVRQFMHVHVKSVFVMCFYIHLFLVPVFKSEVSKLTSMGDVRNALSLQPGPSTTLKKGFFNYDLTYTVCMFS